MFNAELLLHDNVELGEGGAVRGAKKALKIKSFAIALGSASGLPTLPFSLTLYGGSRALTAFDIMLRTSISSNLLNSSYFFQSLGIDLFPWFLLNTISLRLHRVSYH
ncbi:MAG: hypothetical protein GU362_06705 [Thaumarchaeota archaeon]|nr:hypothetical protein [Nitrososphaerota archaeon]